MKIGILGIGRLGLCFALNLERSGYEVLGVDASEDYVSQLNSKIFFSHETGVNELLKTSTNFRASTSLNEVLNDDYPLVFIMVATPTVADGSYDHSQIERVIADLVKAGKRDKKINLVIGCTVMPGYCSDLQKRLASYNYSISYNPEFISQGNIINDQLHCDQVLIGEADNEAGDILEGIYKTLCKSDPVFCRMNTLSAEICKIATNCFLTTKISFANSIGDIATRAGAEPEKILAAIGADSRIGSKYLKYGFGFGGPCFPRDNRALNLFAKMQGYDMLIGEATDEINRRHLQFQFEEYTKHFKQEEAIVFEGVAYKKGTIILEESQQLELALKLARAGRRVLVKEQATVVEALKLLYGDLFTYEVIRL